jgi:hypothetical protein
MSDPKFSLWMGDGWPGPYVLIYEESNHQPRKCVVVNGARDIVEAAAVAQAEFGQQDDYKSLYLMPAKVAEASHHLDTLKELRENESDSKTNS